MSDIRAQNSLQEPKSMEFPVWPYGYFQCMRSNLKETKQVKNSVNAKNHITKCTLKLHILFCCNSCHTRLGYLVQHPYIDKKRCAPSLPVLIIFCFCDARNNIQGAENIPTVLTNVTSIVDKSINNY